MSKQQTQSSIQKSLKMIQYYANKQKNIHDMIISFYYSAKMLYEYHQRYSPQQLKTALFYRFCDEYNKFFLNRDLLSLKNKGNLETIRAVKYLMNQWNKIHTIKPDSQGVIQQERSEMSMSRYSHRRSKVNYIPVYDNKSKFTVSQIQELLKTKQPAQQQTDQTHHQNTPYNSNYHSNLQIKNSSNHQTQPGTIISKYKPNPNYERSIRTHRQYNRADGVNQTFIDNLDSLKGSNSSSNFNGMALNNKSNPNAELREIINQIMYYYRQHKLDLAANLTNKALNMMDNMNLNPLDSGTQKDQLYEILYQYRQMMECYSHFNTPGWKLDKQEKGTKIYLDNTKKNEVGVLIQAELDVDPLKFFIIAAQIDLFNKFIPLCYDCKELKRISRNIIYATSKINLPIPLVSDRQIFFIATAIDRLQKNGSIFVYSKTVQDDKRSQQKYNITVPPQGKCVRFSYIYFMVECQILGKNKIKVKLASNVDMKMNLLPNFVIALAARKFTTDTFMAMIKYQKMFDSTQWAKKRVQRRQIYDYYEKIINEHVRRLGNR